MYLAVQDISNSVPCSESAAAFNHFVSLLALRPLLAVKFSDFRVEDESLLALIFAFMTREGETIPLRRVPVNARYVPSSPGSVLRKCEEPTSGKSPIPHSGIAKIVLRQKYNALESSYKPPALHFQLQFWEQSSFFPCYSKKEGRKNYNLPSHANLRGWKNQAEKVSLHSKY